MSNASAEHQALHHGLAIVHTALRRSLDMVVATAGKPVPEADRAGFADFCERTAKFVRAHHDSEEEIFFPVFEKAGMADKIKTWRGEHTALLDELDQLDAAIAGFKTRGETERLATSATSVREALFPHLDAEEAALDLAVLQQAVSTEQAAALATAASKHGQKHVGTRGLMLFLHALTAEEQRSHFGKMPWFLRKVLIPIWDRNWKPCAKYAYNAAIAL
jgi:hemerythrin-like domain-containing protein